MKQNESPEALTGGADASEDHDIRLLLMLEFAPGSIDVVIERLRPNVLLTRAEAGCLDFQVLRVDGSEATICILEHWRSQADLDAHWREPYMADVFALFDEYLTHPLSDAEDVLRLTDVMAP